MSSTTMNPMLVTIWKFDSTIYKEVWLSSIYISHLPLIEFIFLVVDYSNLYNLSKYIIIRLSLLYFSKKKLSLLYCGNALGSMDSFLKIQDALLCGTDFSPYTHQSKPHRLNLFFFWKDGLINETSQNSE